MAQGYSVWLETSADSVGGYFAYCCWGWGLGVGWVGAHRAGGELLSSSLSRVKTHGGFLKNGCSPCPHDYVQWAMRKQKKSFKFFVSYSRGKKKKAPV